MKPEDTQKVKENICPKCGGGLDETDHPLDGEENEVFKPLVCYNCQRGYNVIYEFKGVESVDIDGNPLDDIEGHDIGSNATPADIEQI